ncbi:LAMI_0E14444g1_1 [Lachancea mirantina]|uniref:LAMI_0E14444g1_1 n=1 Tax=Lachancea mirantina TaxID=1230905 RepID=A0A1G4JRK9_9SACH|nr:LAMI_0E14444g1_1 [Lachancea mirantina]
MTRAENIELATSSSGTSTPSNGGPEKSGAHTDHVDLAGANAQRLESHVHSVMVDGDLVHLGDRTYRRSELTNAFAGDLNPGIHMRAPVALANPVPLGLASFSYSCLLLSLLNANVRGVTNNQIVVGAGLFFGGAIELCAGLLCFATGNTYAMTVFGAFGGFWISYAAILLDQFGIMSAYKDDPAMLNNALGFYLTGWTVFTFLMFMCTLKSTWGLFLLFFFLQFTFLLLTIGYFIDNVHVKQAGGYFGILSAVCGFYSLYSGVADSSNSYFPVRAYYMPNAPTV